MNKQKYLLDSREKIVVENKNFFLRIRSTNLNNPVVLFLHGGPGNPNRHAIMKNLSVLCDICTIVAWDQTGSGKAYNKEQEKKKISIDSIVEDAHTCIEYLKKQFHQDKIYIVGHSWGTVVGVLLAQKYPNDIATYVGIGQFINGVENERILYQFVIDKAHERNDKKGIKELEEIGQPIQGKYKDNKIAQIRNYLHKYGGASYESKKSIWADVAEGIPLMLSEYTITEIFKYIKGMNYSLKYLDISMVDFLTTAKEIKVPVVLMLGHHDYNCPFELAEQWFNNLIAPSKKLIWFEKSGHCPQYEENALWCQTFAKTIFDKNI